MNNSLLKKGNLVFLGAGNMAEALARGILRSGLCPAGRIRVADPLPERLAIFHKEFGVVGTADNKQAVRDAEIVILAVKPQVMGQVLDELKGALTRDALVISIAAGIPTGRYEAALGDGCRVVRVMPNTPALVRCGASAVCGGRRATEADLQSAEAIMKAVGVVVRTKEQDMDAVTAVSGSGPAYVFYLVEAVLEAARRLGLEEAAAKKLFYETVEGVARLIKETGLEAGELRRRVTSKGGTTAAAVEVLENRKVKEALVDAVLAAHRRSRELSQS